MFTSFPEDKRRYPRVICAAAVRVAPLTPGTAATGWQLLCENLSIGGLRISTPVTLPVDARLLVDLDLEDGSEPVRTYARVVWTAWDPALDHWNSGLQFTELAQPERWRLQRLVTQALAIPAGDAGA